MAITSKSFTAAAQTSGDTCKAHPLAKIRKRWFGKKGKGGVADANMGRIKQGRYPLTQENRFAKHNPNSKTAKYRANEALHKRALRRQAQSELGAYKGKRMKATTVAYPR